MTAAKKAFYLFVFLLFLAVIAEFFYRGKTGGGGLTDGPPLHQPVPEILETVPQEQPYAETEQFTGPPPPKKIPDFVKGG